MFTEGKWLIQYDGNDVAEYIYCEDTTQWICNIKRTPLNPPLEEIKRREANAKRICQCVNNFDVLVEALEEAKKALRVAGMEIGYHRIIDLAENKAEQALAAAKGA